MANVLSQAEIDELLSAMAAGTDEPVESDVETEESNVKPYDFRTANKFSKDQMRTLSIIYENYATRISTLLSATLRTYCEFKVVSVEEQTFSEFSHSMPAPVVLPIIRMKPLVGSLLLEIMPSIAFEMINRMLGGSSKFTDIDKQFTEIELSVLECLVRKIIPPMDGAWEKIQSVKASLDRIETSAQYAQVVSSHEPIAIITMSAKIGEVSDVIHLCIPHLAIEPIAKHLVIKTWYSDERNNRKLESEVVTNRLNLSEVNVDLTAVLRDTTATIGEIMSTQVGDVIKMNHHISRPVTIKVEHIPKFEGFVGLQDSNHAVKVVNIIKKEREFDNAEGRVD